MENKKKQENSVELIRHSLAHVMALAVTRLYGDVKFGVGPSIDNGFYYDLDIKRKISFEDLSDIEKEMRKIIKEDIVFKNKTVSLLEASKIFKNQPYKLELLKDIKKYGTTDLSEKTENKKVDVVDIYETDSFVDLCRGPHVKSTKELPEAFKLLRVSGAYWRGDEKNPMLQRIYGTAWLDQKALADHLQMLIDMKERDHRKIGEDLGLFVFSDLVGKGLPLFTEKGAAIRRELERFIVDEEIKRGYQHVYTPELAKVDLYKKSGHYPYYKDTMYPVMKVDEEELILRPMTCPHHFQLYLSRPRSYKELPIRFAELAKQYRYEKSGELSGLVRLRSFCLADAHIICQKDQAVSEINNVLDLIEYASGVLGLQKGQDYSYRLSLGDKSNSKKYYKDDKAWDFAEEVLRSVLIKRKAPFYEAKNEAAFYGPKIDIQMKNFAGIENTAFTVQYDFVMPKRFALMYIDKDGSEKEAVVIHRSSIGAVERVMAFLIEHHAGAFPLWLAPIQVAILPLSEKHIDYSQIVYQKLRDLDFRVELTNANETLGKRIRESESQKIPCILILGDKEEKAKTVSLRRRGLGDLGAVKMDKFLELISKERSEKLLNPLPLE